VENKNIQKTIKNSINKYFGNDSEYTLIKTGTNQYILVTPYLDDKNDFIELEVYPTDKNKLVISDFGRALKHLFKSGAGFQRKGILYTQIKKITNYAGVDIRENKFEIKTDFKSAGKSISSMVRALQRIYSLSNLSEEEVRRKFGDILKEIYKSNYGNKDHPASSPEDNTNS
jgi:hypothetical protein